MLSAGSVNPEPIAPGEIGSTWVTAVL
jgi:hypothetical protein